MIQSPPRNPCRVRTSGAVAPTSKRASPCTFVPFSSLDRTAPTVIMAHMWSAISLKLDDRWLPKSVICLREYSLNKFSKDLIAGVTVGLVALPLAMAFAIAGAVAKEPVLIKNADAIATSFPSFVHLANQLQLQLEEVAQ